MTASNKQKYTIALYVSLGLVALSLILRLLSMLLFYDKDMAYYSAGAVLPIISTVFFLLSVLGIILMHFLFLDGIESKPLPMGISRYVALLPAGALIYQAILLISAMTENVDTYLLLTLAAALISAGFFVSIAFSKQPVSFTVLLGLGLILWLALVWMRSYTDFTLQMNSPDKLFFHFGCIGAAFLCVAELRSLADTFKPRIHFCWLTVAILALSSSVLVSLICKLCGVFKNNSMHAEEIVLLAILVYTVVRALTSLTSIKALPETLESPEE